MNRNKHGTFILRISIMVSFLTVPAHCVDFIQLFALITVSLDSIWQTSACLTHSTVKKNTARK